MPETPSTAAPAAASPTNQVSLPRWDELKREYNLRQKALMRYSAAAGLSAVSRDPANAPEDTPR